MHRWILLTIFACTLRATFGNDVLTLMETKGDVDIDAIKSLDPTTTKQLYKIKAIPGQNGTKDWKYAILARDVSDTFSQDSYVAALQGLQFVETTETYTIHPDSSLTLAFTNFMIKVAKIVGTLFGTLPKRPLKPYSPPWSTCSAITVDVPGSDNFFAMSMQEIGDRDALKKFGEVVMFHAFPALGVKMAYSGTPVTKDWDNFNMQDYGDKKVFCEWALSAMAVENGMRYVKAIKKTQAFTVIAL